MACPAIASDSRMFVEARQLIFDRVIPDGAQIVRILQGVRDVDCALFLEGLERWVVRKRISVCGLSPRYDWMSGDSETLVVKRNSFQGPLSLASV